MTYIRPSISAGVPVEQLDMELYAEQRANDAKNAFKRDYLLVAAGHVLEQAGVEEEGIDRHNPSKLDIGYARSNTVSIIKTRASRLIPTGEIEPWGAAGRYRYIKIIESKVRIFERGRLHRIIGDRALTPIPSRDRELLTFSEYAGINPENADIQPSHDTPMYIQRIRSRRSMPEGSIAAMDRLAACLGDIVLFNGYDLPSPRAIKTAEV